jgi:hypothetical protein
MAEEMETTPQPTNWTAASIRDQWNKDGDVERALKRVNRELRRTKEETDMMSRYPDPSVLYDPTMGMHASMVTPEELQRPIAEQRELLNLLQELEELQSPNAPKSKNASNPSMGLQPIVWKGVGLDLGRTFLAIENLLDCTQSEWERHFIGPKGETFEGVVSEAKRNSNSISRSSAVIKLQGQTKDYKAF